jgi:hypothetical protein
VSTHGADERSTPNSTLNHSVATTPAMASETVPQARRGADTEDGDGSSSVRAGDHAMHLKPEAIASSRPIRRHCDP